MRLLLDINVWLDPVFERAGAAASSALIAACDREHEAWLAWHSVAGVTRLPRDEPREGLQNSARRKKSEFLRSTGRKANV